jgi:hypothetical protein
MIELIIVGVEINKSFAGSCPRHFKSIRPLLVAVPQA